MEIEDIPGEPKLRYEYKWSIGELEKAVDALIPMYKHVISNIKNPIIWTSTGQMLIFRLYMQKILKKCYTKSQMVKIYREALSKELLSRNSDFETWICAKAGKSGSGILNITFVLPPEGGKCEKDCDYCPNDPRVARSYRLGEPAVDRGFQNGWDAKRQFDSRAMELFNMGHQISKLEFIIEGGTFHSYDQKFIQDFVRDCYFAANVLMGIQRERLTLEEEMKINETSNQSVIGLTIETRPDMITKSQIQEFRKLGVTRVQVGIQSIFDTILKGVNRDLPTRKAIHGLWILKQNGFKVDLHWMPDLPGTTPELDMLMMRWVCGEVINPSEISDDAYRRMGLQGSDLIKQLNTVLIGDQWKLYPTMVLPDTKIKLWHDYAKSIGATETDLNHNPKIYVPYGSDHEQMNKLLIYVATHTPMYVRKNREVRDFRRNEISGGTDRLDLRDIISKIIVGRGLKETDIRSREVRTKFIDIYNSVVYIQEYEASKGKEIHITLESTDRSILYGFCRLRLNRDWVKVYFQALLGKAYIRELHVYGAVIPQGQSASEIKTQHLGIGKFLMYIAESIAQSRGYLGMAVISGIGTRAYYAKLNYHLDDTYMVKTFNKETSFNCPELWKSKLPDQFVNTLVPKHSFKYQTLKITVSIIAIIAEIVYAVTL